MPRPEDFDQWFARWKKLTESLFGTVEDIAHDEAKEILAASHIDAERLRDELYAKLSKYASSLRMKGQSVPDHVVEALETFRPETAPPRNIKEIERRAERWFDWLLHPPYETPVQPQIAFSYRNKAELLSEDRTVLDKLAQKLEEKIRRK